ncbi:hypothetical protein FA13DRAFT_230516 [Coprinellus micaceus]|uniref:F-box domain-containing protein n=1 Tax=Coprinellus micaceus TaxID=71717 RepID=A0A4Y7THA3_COPMI|nr:hypothetical protein FA13DRAFT_230516 [Coprinellus micaceus]
MPVPLFPKLRAAKISPVDFMSLKTFSLFISPSMRRLQVDLDRVSQEGGPLRLPPHLIIQATTAATQNLQLLHYTGPTDKAFFPHLVKLTSLTSLTLYLAGWQDAWELRCLRGLPLLEHVANLFLDSLGAASADNPMTGLRIHSHTSLTNLRSLDILAKQYQHCLVARSLSPRSLKKLILGFFAAIDAMPVHLALGLYLQANPNLEVLDVRFGEAALGVSPEVLPLESRVHWPTVHDASDVLSSALQASRSIREILLHHIPFHLAIPTSRILCDAMPSIGASLVSLRMYVNVKPVPNSGESASQGTAFPGLSFLASTVRLRCPSLKRLAFHFDANIVRHEDLAESLRHCEERLQQLATSGHLSRDHQLSFLEVSSGTPTETSIQIGLSVDRKVKIASFLDRLFPHLNDVSGSGVWGPGTWLNINDLIKSFQDVRRTGSHRDVVDIAN